MILYHGTTLEIEEIDLNKSKPNKDFGKGFYLSAEKEQAIAMAAYKAEQLDKEAVVNVFEFDESNLTNGTLKVKWFKEYNQEWAEFIFKNRNNATEIPVHDYDIVIGPIANDRVGVQMRKYMEHEIDMKRALHTLYTSDTYAKLQDTKTGLYFQSPRYVYDFLKTEIKTGKLE